MTSRGCGPNSASRLHTPDIEARREAGLSTQRDPIGLGGGLNQYGYVGADPINRSDPFGLCSQAADSVQVTVTVDCPTGPDETATVWAQRVSEAEEQAILAAAGRLTGGSRRYRPSDVSIAYQAQASSGGFFSIPVSLNGGTVIEGGITQLINGAAAVAFRADVLSALSNGDLGMPIGTGRRAQNVANIVGHEGVHLLGEPGELIPLRIRWGFRP